MQEALGRFSAERWASGVIKKLTFDRISDIPALEAATEILNAERLVRIPVKMTADSGLS